MCRRDFFTGLIVAVIWGFNFIAIKLGLEDVPPLLLSTLRFLAASLPAIFFLPRPQIAWRCLIALGLTINVGQFAFLFMGIKLGMPAGLASLMIQSQVFFTLLIAVIFIKESLHWNHIVGLLISAGGMAVIGCQQGGNMTAVGFWLTLTAAVSWGAGNVIMRWTTKDAPSYSILSLIVWAGAVASIPLAVLSLLIEGPAAWQAAWYSFTWTTVCSVIYLAYFATLCGYALWGKLLSHYPTAVVTPFALLVPVIGMSSSVIVLGETLTLWQIGGALLVMAGLVINLLGGKLDNYAVALLKTLRKSYEK